MRSHCARSAQGLEATAGPGAVAPAVGSANLWKCRKLQPKRPVAAARTFKDPEHPKKIQHSKLQNDQMEEL